MNKRTLGTKRQPKASDDGENVSERWRGERIPGTACKGFTGRNQRIVQSSRIGIGASEDFSDSSPSRESRLVDRSRKCQHGRGWDRRGTSKGLRNRIAKTSAERQGSRTPCGRIESGKPSRERGVSGEVQARRGLCGSSSCWWAYSAASMPCYIGRCTFLESAISRTGLKMPTGMA